MAAGAIPKEKRGELMLRYAEVGSFATVAREFGCAGFTVRRYWVALSAKEQQSYKDKVKIHNDEIEKSFIVKNDTEIISYVESVITLRNLLLAKLFKEIKNIDETFKNSEKKIIMLRESANALKTIVSVVSPDDQDETRSSAEDFISKIRKASEIQN